MSRKVFVHVGAPKTGTTYLQDRLALNARTLAEHSVHFPSSGSVDPALFQFRAALDLLGQDWGGPPGHAAGGWSALTRRVRRRSGTVVISHEILAPAVSGQVARAMRDLAGSEVHVVYTARDLARQVPAAWQESIKQGRTWSYRRFLERMEHNKTWFSRAFDLPGVLSTWGAGLPPERIHVVTLPQPGARRNGAPLWDRMCEVLGIDPRWAPQDSYRSNQSLGRSETQVIRQLNKRMKRSPRREGAYDELIRSMLDQGELVRRESAAVRLPPDRFDWAEERAERWIDWIRGSGVHVVGDVDELRPVRPAPGERYRDPDRVSRKRQLATALDALSSMTREAARRPDPDRALTTRVRAQAERLRHR